MRQHAPNELTAVHVLGWRERSLQGQGGCAYPRTRPFASVFGERDNVDNFRDKTCNMLLQIPNAQHSSITATQRPY